MERTTLLVLSLVAMALAAPQYAPAAPAPSDQGYPAAAAAPAPSDPGYPAAAPVPAPSDPGYPVAAPSPPVFGGGGYALSNAPGLVPNLAPTFSFSPSFSPGFSSGYSSSFSPAPYPVAAPSVSADPGFGSVVVSGGGIPALAEYPAAAPAPLPAPVPAPVLAPAPALLSGPGFGSFIVSGPAAPAGYQGGYQGGYQYSLPASFAPAAVQVSGGSDPITLPGIVPGPVSASFAPAPVSVGSFGSFAPQQFYSAPSFVQYSAPAPAAPVVQYQQQVSLVPTSPAAPSAGLPAGYAGGPPASEYGPPKS